VSNSDNYGILVNGRRQGMTNMGICRTNSEAMTKIRELESINNKLDCPSSLTKEEFMKLGRRKEAIMNWLDGAGWRK